MGNQDQIEGKWDQATGKVKEEVGDAIGNEQMEYEGKADQAKGNVKEGVGDVRGRSTMPPTTQGRDRRTATAEPTRYSRRSRVPKRDPAF